MDGSAPESDHRPTGRSSSFKGDRWPSLTCHVQWGLWGSLEKNVLYLKTLCTKTPIPKETSLLHAFSYKKGSNDTGCHRWKTSDQALGIQLNKLRIGNRRRRGQILTVWSVEAVTGLLPLVLHDSTDLANEGLIADPVIEIVTDSPHLALIQQSPSSSFSPSAPPSLQLRDDDVSRSSFATVLDEEIAKC
ncbi:hypothetical protein U1Q18_005631 [Sarracenia purpurea var. burkii]